MKEYSEFRFNIVLKICSGETVVKWSSSLCGISCFVITFSYICKEKFASLGITVRAKLTACSNSLIIFRSR